MVTPPGPLVVVIVGLAVGAWVAPVVVSFVVVGPGDADGELAMDQNLERNTQRRLGSEEAAVPTYSMSSSGSR